MRKRVALVALVIASVATMVGVASATQPDPEHKVTICHRTSAEGNPYGPKAIEVDIASILQEGHASHTGGVFPEPNWGDIIPAFDFGPGEQFAGLNHVLGALILANDCQIPCPELNTLQNVTPTTEPCEPPTTDTTEPPTTDTTEPPTTETTVNPCPDPPCVPDTQVTVPPTTSPPDDPPPDDTTPPDVPGDPNDPPTSTTSGTPTNTGTSSNPKFTG
jgi:hypothetical protein